MLHGPAVEANRRVEAHCLDRSDRLPVGILYLLAGEIPPGDGGIGKQTVGNIGRLATHFGRQKRTPELRRPVNSGLHMSKA